MRNSENRVTAELSAQEIKTAEKLWISNIQSDCYGDEIKLLKSNERKHGQLVKQLKLFVDTDNIVRCGGRLHNAPLTETAKFPALLPKYHHFTRLIVQYHHRHSKHIGLQGTVTAIRQYYWIPSIRVTRKCVTCKFVIGLSYQAPIKAPLPVLRVTDRPAFTVTGVDFTGELYIKLYIKLEVGKEAKRYVCLFTCATTRGVHLELVDNMTTSAFLRAFRRFAARRSLPNRMLSDNASTYEAAAKEIHELMKSPSVKAFLANHLVQWDFIPKRAPWFGGFWERLIGITKLCLKKVLRRAYVYEDELRTLLAEVEAVINDRPLTYVYGDSNEPLPLTPSQLIVGRNITTLPYDEIDINELRDPNYMTQPLLENRSHRLAKLLQHFHTRWIEEYLTALKERDFNVTKGSTKNEIKVGDIVLVHDDQKKRTHWKLAVVQKLKPGNDGLVRSAEIKTANGYSNRPVTKLYPLEINNDDTSETESTESVVETCDATTRSQRPVRQATKNAMKNIKEWTKLISD
ncbi:uncharacterized protein LOC144445269 [Glandiceps talaboti]